jgi:hypothetical protein
MALRDIESVHARMAKEAIREAIKSVRSTKRVLRGGDCRAGYDSLVGAFRELAEADAELQHVSGQSGRTLRKAARKVGIFIARLNLAFRRGCIR